MRLLPGGEFMEPVGGPRPFSDICSHERVAAKQTFGEASIPTAETLAQACVELVVPPSGY